MAQPEKKMITVYEAIEMMKTSTSIVFYEYYNGVEVNDDYLIFIKDDNSEETAVQCEIFNALPNTTLESFEYSSRFGSEFDVFNFRGFPPTLKELSLMSYNGISTEMIERFIASPHLKCYHCAQEIYDDNEEIVTDDSKTYQLLDGKWRKIT